MPWPHALLGALICAPFLLCALAARRLRNDHQRRAHLRAVNDRRVRARLGLRP